MPDSRLQDLKTSFCELFSPFLRRYVVTIKGYMVNTLATLVEEFAHTGWSSNGLHDLEDNIAMSSKSNPQVKLSGLAKIFAIRNGVRVEFKYLEGANPEFG